MTFDAMPAMKREAIRKAIWARGDGASHFAWDRYYEAMLARKPRTAAFWMAFYIWVDSM
jgi:hypothetical protein